MLARCGRVAHICEANCICNKFFLLQLHFLKLANSQLDCFYETSYKFGQGNGAIAARWQAKAGVEPPFAGCERPFSLREVLLGKPHESGSARLGHIPSLPWESQLPLKPYLSLQHSDSEWQLQFFRFSLRFLFHFIVRFCYLLRKRGLLAHTSAAFLKNCCTEKLFICLRLVSCTPYPHKSPLPLSYPHSLSNI